MKKVIMLTVTLFAGYVNAQPWNQSGDNYSTGKLGIGFSSAPYYDVDISKTTPYLRIHTSSYSNNPAVLTRKGGIIFNQENNDKTAAVLFAVPPGYHVPGILFATKTAWNVPSSSPTDWYDRMFIHPNGNVGIGTVDPGAFKLHTAGNIRMGGQATVGRSGSHYDEFTYNVGFTTTNDQYTYVGTDAAASIRMGYQGSIEFRTAPSGSAGSALALTNRMNIKQDGNVGIGTTNPDAKLAVNGTIHSKEVKVDMNNWSDYVFNKDYKLRSLSEVQQYIEENHHLPDVPSEKEVLANGQNLGEMNAILLRKIEELTLYVLELKNQNQSLINRVQHLESRK